MMTTLLSIVIIGLIISYIVLIFYIRKYYYASMKRETWRLTLLFAALNISYVCRVIYLSVRYYNKALIQDKFYRTFVSRAAPLVWDLSSIVAILYLHFMSFREGNNRQIELPKAGHFKKKSTLPNVDDKSFNDSVTLETAR